MSEVTDIGKPSASRKFEIYPNPNNGVFQIRGTSSFLEEYLILEVYDVTGREILRLSGSELISDYWNLDIRPYGAGMYLVHLLHNGHSYSFRMVVQ